MRWNKVRRKNKEMSGAFRLRGGPRAVKKRKKNEGSPGGRLLNIRDKGGDSPSLKKIKRRETKNRSGKTLWINRPEVVKAKGENNKVKKVRQDTGSGTFPTGRNSGTGQPGGWKETQSAEGQKNNTIIQFTQALRGKKSPYSG